jgi:DNA adenine methylase
MKLKTPLRYPGGKSRAIPKLCEWLPSREITEYREPFLGGGSMALEMTKRLPEDVPIWVNDLYKPLINFWKVLQTDGEPLTQIILDRKKQHPDQDSARKLFSEAKDILNDATQTTVDRAAAFYIVNKCSFSGLTESSSFSKSASDSNFSIRGIERLPEYSKLIQRWKITSLSYEELCTDDELTFIYVDPPYDIKDALYGYKGDKHRGFDHKTFADIMDRQLCNVMISYNDHPDIVMRFLEWCQYDFDHTYTMRSTGTYMSDQTKRRELVLTNYGKFGGSCTAIGQGTTVSHT